MGLQLILGRSGTGKTELCLQEIAARQAQNIQTPLILIVPEQFSLQAERDLIRKTGGKGIMQAQVLSFRRLAFRVFREAGGSSAALLGDVGKSMVLRKILLEREKELAYFAGAIHKQGFMEQLSSTISEFFQYEIHQDKIAEMAGKWEDGSPIQRKLLDLSKIYEGYLEFTKNDYVSTDDALDVLAEKIAPSSFLQNGEIWMDGFYGFTPQELRVIEKLLQTVRTVHITLTIDEASLQSKNITYISPFFETMETKVKLERIAGENGIEIKKPVILKKPFRFKTKAMGVLEENWLAYKPKGSRVKKGLRIFAASDRHQEIIDTAEEIIRLVREYGFRYRDIAIVSRALGDYESNIKGILQEYRIPYFIDTKREIISNPMVELIRSIIAMCTYDFQYEGVFRYLKTGLTGVPKEHIDRVENYVLSYGIKGYKWFLDEWKYGFSESEEDRERYRTINAIKDEITAPLYPFIQKIQKGKRYTVRFITEQIFALLKALNVTIRLEAKIEGMLAENNVTGAYEYRQCFQNMTAVFEKLVEILGDDEMSIEEYGKIIDAGLIESDMGIIPPGVDQVIIGDIERTRLPKIRALFVIGVNDGILPAPPAAQGIFSELEREELENKGVELSHNAIRRTFEENFLIYCGITKAEELISFSYAFSNLDGKTLRPSAVITKLKKIFPLIEETTEGTKEPLHSISQAEPTFHQLGIKLKAYIDTGELNPIWMDAFEYYQRHRDWRPRTQLLVKGLMEKNKPGKLEREELNRLYHKELYSSVSRLEQFAACPFSYFVQYGLRAKERKLYEMNTPDLGLLFHSVLESFSRELIEQGKNWRQLTLAETEKMIDAAVEKKAPEIGSEVLLSTASYKYIVKRLKRISKRAITTLEEHIKRGSFEPFGYEVGFGIEEALPPIVIELSSGDKLVLTGKIDRVDVLEASGKQYIKIIDYKSGKKNFQLQDIYYGLQLQLLLYLNAFLESGKELAGGQLFPAGVFYFRITDPMISSMETLSGEELNRLLLKELKMSGLVLADKTILSAIDCEFSKETGAVSSDIIAVGTTKAGELRKDAAAVDAAQYTAVLQFAKLRARSLGERILSGEIDIFPYKRGKYSACDYCSFRSVCCFDETKNEYHYLKELKKEELWNKIENEISLQNPELTDKE